MEERGFMSPSLTISASYREGGSKGLSRRRSMRPSFDADNEIMNLLHGSDPVRIELNRLENEVRDKNRESSEAQAEIKALRLSERQREKAVEELTEELGKMAEKLKLIENLLESKNLEIKKINEEKKASMAAQFAAEASLRRVHAAQKDDDMPPIEAILAPLEAELKLARLEIAKLQDDNKSLDRLTKSKEAALLEAEWTVQSALAKASMVDDLQNKNQELMKQIEICQEENKIIDKMHRQKVAEVEKLMQSVRELEEAVLAGGAAANAVRDYQRKFQEMNEERKILERELARAKVNANRVATVVANEWKDASDKVMPVRIRPGGDRIYGVFDHQLPAALKKLPFDRHLSTKNVQKVVSEADGYQPHLIAPEQGYRRLIDGSISYFKGPAEATVDAVHFVLKELVRKSISETEELKRFPTLASDIAAAANEALERFRDESRKTVLRLVDMESSYLTVEFFRKLHLEPEKEKPNPRNAPAPNADPYSDNHFRKIGSNVSAYINMVCDTLRNSLPKAVVYCQVREAKRSLLNFFYAQVGRKEKEKLGAMLDEDPQLMERRGTLAKRLELYKQARDDIDAVAWK